MKYFVRNQYGNLSIQDWDQDMSHNKAFTALTQEQLDFLSQYPDASVRQVQNLLPPPPPPTPEELLQKVKADKIAALMDYDSSPAVNEFFIGTAGLWLDKDTRTGLMLRFNAEQASGQADTTLWYDTLSFDLPIATAIQILYAVELYASACYDKTAQHRHAIDELTDIEDVEAYDFTTGYPDKLRF